MLSRPTTEQVIAGVLGDLDRLVLPELDEGPGRVALQMIEQLLRGAAVRAAHEIAWMHEEIADIRDSISSVADDPAVAAALADLDALDPASLHLDDVQRRYSAASEALSCAADVAYAAGDQPLIARLQDVLDRRSAHEMQIVGQLDLVGRG
jgi:hypothetical protein